jgi:hypothetical protein
MRFYHIAAAVTASTALAACSIDKVLDVPDVDVLTPGVLDTKQSLPALVAGTAANFQIAFSGGADLTNGGHEGIVNLSGLFADEFLHAETFPDRQLVDQRAVAAGNGSVKGVFFDLSKARAFADLASERFNRFDKGGTGHAEVLNLGAYAYLLFGETFCSGVPFSTLTDAGVQFGDPQTRDQMYTSALARFDTALTYALAKQDVPQSRLARIGRARALLNLGRFAEAAQAVSGVPTSFSYEIEGSTNSTRQNNGVWNYTINFFGFGVTDREGGNGIPWMEANDPRAPFVDTGELGFDGETPYVAQQRYPDKTSNVPLATGVEARLAEGEALLRSGDGAGAMAVLAALRDAAGLEPLDDPGTAQGRIDVVFAERGYWTYLSGQRMGSLRRLVRQYGRTQGQVFPSGPYHKGGTYGSDVTLPVSADELNNPKFRGCIDRNA